MAVSCGLDLLCLLLMKNRISPPPAKEDIVPLWRVIKILFTNRGFLCVIVATVLWQCAHYTILGFMGTYELEELALSVGLVQIIKNSGVLARFAMTRPIAHYTDKHTYAKGLALGISIAAVGYFLNIFTSPRFWWILIAYTVLNAVANAGIGQNFLNISYNFIDEKYFVQASALRNSIGGVCGFLAALAGGRILTAVQENGNMVLGIPMYGQQLLSAISFLFAVAALLFIRLALEKQKTIAK
jgi:Na+/melibiose symporter-like transporter